MGDFAACAAYGWVACTWPDSLRRRTQCHAYDSGDTEYTDAVIYRDTARRNDVK